MPRDERAHGPRAAKDEALAFGHDVPAAVTSSKAPCARASRRPRPRPRPSRSRRATSAARSSASPDLTGPHPHGESWNNVATTAATAEGGAWYFVPTPWGALPGWGVDLVARYTSPDGGSGPGLSFSYDCF